MNDALSNLLPGEKRTFSNGATGGLAMVAVGDCKIGLRSLPEASIDSVVCDPPYGLEFMGHDWDRIDGDVVANPAEEGGFQDGAGGNAYSRSRIRYGTGKTAPGGGVGWAPGQLSDTQNLPEGNVFREKGFGKMPIYRGMTGEQKNPMQAWHEEWARECLRVLKPGGHLLAFSSSRTYHRLAAAIEDAGFEIRDMIHWTYGSGFPKSKNLPGGLGSALKPSHEPIVVARKPLAGTLAENHAKHGVGPYNIDQSRVAYHSLDEFAALAENRLANRTVRDGEVASGFGMKPEGLAATEQSPIGRWPANTILTHAPDCKQHGMKRIKAITGGGGVKTHAGGFGPNHGREGQSEYPPVLGYGDADGMETVPNWECAASCPVALMDDQSGDRPGCKPHILQSSPESAQAHRDAGWGTLSPTVPRMAGYDDEGGASRFMQQSNWEPDENDWVPFFYTPKPNQRERDAGLENLPRRPRGAPDGATVDNSLKGPTNALRPDDATESANFHPTVKPISLMHYLVRLVTPPGGIVVDPFLGSGTTLCAAILHGYQGIGFELSPDYAAIAEARLAYYSRCLIHKRTGAVIPPQPKGGRLLDYIGETCQPQPSSPSATSIPARSVPP
jgi:DNA modification methylase